MTAIAALRDTPLTIPQLTEQVLAIAEALRDQKKPPQVAAAVTTDLLAELSTAELFATRRQEQLIVAAHVLAMATRQWAYALGNPDGDERRVRIWGGFVQAAHGLVLELVETGAAR